MGKDASMWVVNSQRQGAWVQTVWRALTLLATLVERTRHRRTKRREAVLSLLFLSLRWMGKDAPTSEAVFTQAGGIPSTYIARWSDAPARIEQISSSTPNTFLLEQNYPNPFNPSTTIRYQLPVASMVKLEVYDVLGKKEATLVSERQSAGYYQFIWNASGLSSGHIFIVCRQVVLWRRRRWC
jgi:hypothetical protein